MARMSNWLGYDRLEGIVEEGDLIECGIDNIPFACHWAVYIGRMGSNHYVVHRVGHVSTGADTGVKEALLSELFNGRNCRINNSGDETHGIVNSPNVTVDRARSRIGDKEFNIIFANCEHFVNWCRYSEANSEQVRKAIIAAAASSAASSSSSSSSSASCSVF